MARVVLIHGAFNEFSGPYSLRARCLPALRDGLWYHKVEIAAADVGVCFYGDLFRREPGAVVSEAEYSFEKTPQMGITESLANLEGSELFAALGQAASKAAFDRIINMATWRQSLTRAPGCGPEPNP